MSDLSAFGDPKAVMQTAASKKDAEPSKSSATGSSWFSSPWGESHASGGAGQPDASSGAPGSAPDASWDPSSLFGHLADGMTNAFGLGFLGFGGSTPKSRGKKRDESLPEARAEQEKKTPGDPKNELRARWAASGKMVADEYITDPADRVCPRTDTKIGKLNDEDEKMKFLQKFTQNNENDGPTKESESYCGPTSILAAAVYTNGSKGVSPIIKQMQKDAMEKYKKDPDMLQAYAEKMAGIDKRAQTGELTGDDMNTLKQDLYANLHDKSVAIGTKNDPNRDARGVDPMIMQDFMKNSGLSKEMAAHDVKMKYIDNNGDIQMNHYILDFQHGKTDKNPGQRMIYDPYSRRGGQIVTEQDQQNDYSNTNQIEIR